MNSKWLLALVEGPVGRLVAKRLVLALLAALLGGLAGAGLEFGPVQACLESASKSSAFLKVAPLVLPLPV